MQKQKNGVLHVLANLDIIIAGMTLTILIILTFAGVVWRYVLKAPFTWLEEVQLACIVWIVFAAAGAAFRTGNHVAIEMVADIIPAKFQKSLSVFISVVVVAVIGYICKNKIGYIQIFAESGRATSMLKIPYTFIYGIALFSYVDMIISYFYSLVKGIKSEVKGAAEIE